MSEASPYKVTKKQAIVGLDDLISKLDSMIVASEKRQCDKMEALLVDRQDKLLKEVKVENAKVVKKVKEESAKMVKAVDSLRETLSSQEAKMKQLEADLTGLQKKQNQDISNVNKYVKKETSLVDNKAETIKKDLEELQTLVKGHHETAKQSRTSIHKRIDDMNQKVEDLCLTGVAPQLDEFPLNRTAVAKFVRQPDGEDILDVARLVVNDFLGLPLINVVHAKSMSRDDDGYGTLKILLEKPEDLQMVLENKKVLSEYDEDYDVKCIRMRQSKSHEQLVLEQNCDIILKTLELQDDFWRHDGGWLIPKKPNTGRGKGNNFRGRSSRRPWQQGRGRGRGYVTNNGSRNAEWQDNTNNARPPRRKINSGARRRFYGNGENQGRGRGGDSGHDPRDARWAQQEERARNGMGRGAGANNGNRSVDANSNNTDDDRQNSHF